MLIIRLHGWKLNCSNIHIVSLSMCSYCTAWSKWREASTGLIQGRGRRESHASVQNKTGNYTNAAVAKFKHCCIILCWGPMKCSPMYCQIPFYCTPNAHAQFNCLYIGSITGAGGEGEGGEEETESEVWFKIWRAVLHFLSRYWGRWTEDHTPTSSSSLLTLLTTLTISTSSFCWRWLNWWWLLDYLDRQLDRLEIMMLLVTVLFVHSDYSIIITHIKIIPKWSQVYADQHIKSCDCHMSTMVLELIRLDM